MKAVKKDLQTVSKQLKALAAKIEKIEKSVAKAAPAKKKAAAKKAPAKKKTAKKAAPPKGKDGATAIDTVVGLVQKSKNGIEISAIKKKTGYTDKQISNLLYKAKKKGVIKSIGKGVYGKA